MASSGLTMRALVMAAVVLGACRGERAPAPSAGSGSAVAPPAPAGVASPAAPLPSGARARLGGTAYRHPADIEALAVSDDGALVATGSRGVVRVWDARTGATVREAQTYARVTHVAFAGGTVVFAAYRAGLGTLSIADGAKRQLSACPRDDDEISALAAAPDGRAVAVACTDARVVNRVWLASGTAAELAPDLGAAALAWSPDGRWIAAAHGSISLLDAAARTVVPGPSVRGSDHALAFAPTGAVLAYTDATDTGGDLVVWDLATHASRTLFHGDVGAATLAWSRDGARLATTARYAEKRLLIADVATGKVHELIERPIRIAQLAFADAAGTRVWIAHDHAARLWEPATDRELTGPAGHAGAITALAFSPDGKTLASGATDTELRLWDIAAGTSRLAWLPAKRRDDRVRTVVGEIPTVAVGWSADGATMFALDRHGGHGVLRAFTAASFAPGPVSDVQDDLFAGTISGGRVVSVGRAHFDGAVAIAPLPGGTAARASFVTEAVGDHVALSPNGALLAGPRLDGGLAVVATASGREAFRPDARSRAESAFSPDGTRLAIADVGVRVLSLPLGKVIADVALPKGDEATSIAYVSPTQLVVGTRDGAVVIGTIYPGVPLAVDVHPRAHAGAVRALAVAPDARSFATGGDDGQILLWPL